MAEGYLKFKCPDNGAVYNAFGNSARHLVYLNSIFSRIFVKKVLILVCFDYMCACVCNHMNFLVDICNVRLYNSQILSSIYT